jgi:hypothetical protein
MLGAHKAPFLLRPALTREAGQRIGEIWTTNPGFERGSIAPSGSTQAISMRHRFRNTPDPTLNADQGGLCRKFASSASGANLLEAEFEMASLADYAFHFPRMPITLSQSPWLNMQTAIFCCCTVIQLQNGGLRVLAPDRTPFSLAFRSTPSPRYTLIPKVPALS